MGCKVCLSHILRPNTPSYGNRDRVIIRDNSSIRKGETANSSYWIFSSNHMGTHLDPPYHFSENGRKTFEIPVDDYFYEVAQLVDIPCIKARLIGLDDFGKMTGIHPDIELLMIRTGYEKFRNIDKYWNDNPGLSPELADYFRINYPKLRCIGFDFISLTSWKYREQGRESHKEFLDPENGKKEILIIEDMSLAKIQFPIKRVIVAPLFVEDGNGGAVTVFAELKN